MKGPALGHRPNHPPPPLPSPSSRSSNPLLQPQPLAAPERLMPGLVLALTGLYAAAGLVLVSHLSLGVMASFYALLLYRLAVCRWPRLPIGGLLLVPLALMSALLVYRFHGTLVGQEGGTALLTLLLALKLLEIRGSRDLRLAAMLFPFWLVVLVLFDQSPWLALSLGLLLILDMALLATLVPPAGAPRRALMLALRLSLQALPLTLILFVLFPRLDAPLWSFLPAPGVARSGLNDWLEPGSVSELVLDGSLAFRVRFEEALPPAEGLYWRGPVAWNTDGRRWTALGGGDPFTALPKDAERGPETLAYTVTLEPTQQRWLFALDVPVASPEQDVRLTVDGQLLAATPIKESRIYRVISAPRRSGEALSQVQREAGLALPANVTDRMRDLVAGWRKEARDPAELVRLGLRHFHQEPFYYTLKPPPLGDNPVDDFLFESRKGFCEHYASSFTLLMRLGGIPARIVLGYLGGERNPLGDHLIVRQSDAHAWVEVWLEDQGWVRVDPTAHLAPERIEPSPELSDLASGRPLRLRVGGVATWGRLVHGLRLLSDALDESWYRWVLGLDRDRQQALLDRLGLGRWRDYGLALLMVLGGGVALGLLLVWLLRRPRAPALEPGARCYQRFCLALGRQGLARHPAEGPSDYGQRLARVEPRLAPVVLDFTRRYARLHYGRERSSAAELAALGEDLRRVKRALRLIQRGRAERP